MRTIRELLVNEKVVWMYLDNEEVCRDFYRQAHEEGFHFGDLPYEKWVTGYVVAVHANGEMGHLSMFVWTLSFAGKGPCSIRGSHTPVDYQLYMAGEEDYICKSSHFTGVQYVGGGGPYGFKL